METKNECTEDYLAYRKLIVGNDTSVTESEADKMCYSYIEGDYARMIASGYAAILEAKNKL